MKKETFKQVALLATGILLLLAVAVTLVILPLQTKSAEVPTGEKAPADVEAKAQGERLTILVAGTDRTSGLSDVMMLVTLSQDTGEITVLQLPRDTYVNCGKGSYRKLNGVPAALGDMAATRDFLAESLGIPIHRYLCLSPDAFREAVDALGGVEITLSAALDYEDPAQGLSIHLPAGKQTLNGAAAEQFVRFRADYLRGDLGRMDAQKIFLAALAEKARTALSPLTVAKLGMALLGKVETDFSLSDLTSLAAEWGSVSTEKLSFMTAPGADVIATTGASFYVLSAPAMNELLVKCFDGSENGFDTDKVFLYARSKDFSRIYESFAPYTVFSATEIREKGLGIARKE